MEARTCSAKKFIKLCRAAEEKGFNRQVLTDDLKKVIDPSGVNLLSVMVPYHNRINFDFVVEKEKEEDHHRVECFVKVKNQKLPLMLTLDISVDDW